MKNIYDSYFTSHFKRVNDLSVAGFDKSAKYYDYFYKEFLPNDKHLRILDIGCGTGQFLHFLEKERFTNYYGIDVSDQQIDFCKKNITEKVEEADCFEFLLSKKDAFDLVAMNDILEHIPKDRTTELLNLIRDSLREKGVLLIKTPNMANPFSLMDRYKDITHEVGFTEYSLREILEATQFKHILIKGASYPAISLEAVAGKIAEKVIHFCMKIMFLVQGYSSPKILAKNIIAVAQKK
jgi:2-polyprenyl-3-methyl-5-hydroxy-6-metoxy-1,4-benzoquinol methylase